jgi:hypothetical protein
VNLRGAAEQLDAAYQEVKDVKTVPRGLGFWGDMVVTLRNGDKIELRSLPQCDPCWPPLPAWQLSGALSSACVLDRNYLQCTHA